MHILPATPVDLHDLIRISRKIFYDSFHTQNKPENIEAYMDRAYSADQLATELENPGCEYYFICDQENKIGFLKINTPHAQSDLHDPDSLEIERIYVDQAYQGFGLGKQLLEKAKERAITLGLNTIWLGVWEKNTGAIRFYEREGFQLFGSHPFIMGDEEQTDLLMKLVLT